MFQSLPTDLPFSPLSLFLLRHPLHSAYRLSLITALTNGWKTQHKNFAN